MRRLAALLDSALLATAAAGATLEIHGSAIAEYRDAEFSHPDFNAAGLADDNTQPGTFRFLQADIVLEGTVGEWSRYFVRATLPGDSAATLTEAWIGSDALGPGRLTLGQFYRPRGAPIPLFNLSIPSLAMHVFPVVGAKYAGTIEPHRYRYEVGAVRANPLALGSTIGDAPIVGRPLDGTFSDGPTEAYVHFGKILAGEWGSLDIGVTGIYGRMMRADATALANSGLFANPSLDRDRRVLDVFADYLYGPLAVYGEALVMEDGILRHAAWEVGTRHRLRKNLAVLASYGEYRVGTDLTGFGAPAAWDRARTTVSGIWDIAPGLQVLGGYEWNEEDVLGPQGEIDNDAFTLQVLTYW